MASFDPNEIKTDLGQNSARSGVVKYPMKRLELSVRKFIKVLDIDLDRLYKHTENIKKLMNAEDWRGLHREQVNASRTIQQINANIREIERARTQVQESDLKLFDSKIQDVKAKALSAMDEFMEFLGPGLTGTGNGSPSRGPAVLDAEQAGESPPRLTRAPKLHKAASVPSENCHLPGTHSSSSSWNTSLQYDLGTDATSDDPLANSSPAYGSLSAAMVSSYAPAPVTTTLHVAPAQSDASTSWEELQENIVELNELVHHFATEVEQQGEVVNTIDDNIETAHNNVREGTFSLAKASKYKSAMLPAVGAVVGGILGGPVGLYAGMKLGGLAGLMGGAAGFAGGRMLKKRQEKINSVEMENLSEKRSVSLSDDADKDSNCASSGEEGKHSTSRFDQPEETERTGLIDSNHKAQAQAGTGGSMMASMYSSITSPIQQLFYKQPEK